MRAMVLHRPGGPLQLEDVPVPSPTGDEVLVRVRACGLGLTLVWNLKERGSSGAASKIPRVIGHEVAGDVVASGDGASGFRPGDRVVLYYYLVCDECEWCVAGREDLCDRLAGHIGRHRDGGLAEYVAVPARNVCRLPDAVSYEDAAVAADAIATPVHILASRARLALGETLLVIGGGGGVGVHAIAVGKALGARAIAADLGEAKLGAARSAGADAVIDADTEAIGERVAALTDGRGVDVVVDMVGNADTYRTGVEILAKGGRLVFVGSYDPSAELTVSPTRMKRDEVTVTGSRYSTRRELATALRLVEIGQVEPVITRRCSLEEADEVLTLIERKQLPGRAVVVFPGEGQDMAGSRG